MRWGGAGRRYDYCVAYWGYKFEKPWSQDAASLLVGGSGSSSQSSWKASVLEAVPMTAIRTLSITSSHTSPAHDTGIIFMSQPCSWQWESLHSSPLHGSGLSSYTSSPCLWHLGYLTHLPYLHILVPIVAVGYPHVPAMLLTLRLSLHTSLAHDSGLSSYASHAPDTKTIFKY